MILLDANVLVYAVDRDAQRHLQVKPWIEELLSGTESIGFPWLSIVGFLRIVSRPGLLKRLLSVDEAIGFVDDWLSMPIATQISPGPRHWELLRELLHDAGTAGNLTNDAHLAALAIEHGASIASFDYDFQRFPGARLVVPGDSRVLLSPRGGPRSSPS